jgi:hypothetical protein
MMWFSRDFNIILGCLGAVDFIDPSSGSVVANFEGCLNATTLTSCNVSNEGSQLDTFWSVENFRGVAGRQSLGTLRDQNLLLILRMNPFLNQVIVTNWPWTTELDRVIILFCAGL